MQGESVNKLLNLIQFSQPSIQYLFQIGTAHARKLLLLPQTCLTAGFRSQHVLRHVPCAGQYLRSITSIYLASILIHHDIQYRDCKFFCVTGGWPYPFQIFGVVTPCVRLRFVNTPLRGAGMVR